MIIECIDNQEADLLADELLRKDLVTCTQGSGKIVLICDCGCGELFRKHCIEDFQGDPDDSGWDRITTDELRERIAAEDTGEFELSTWGGIEPTVSSVPDVEVLREPTDGDVRVPPGELWTTGASTQGFTTFTSIEPRYGRHEQTRRLQQEYQRILDEAAERHRSDTEWVIVDDTSDT